jgi:hypothetical protein
MNRLLIAVSTLLVSGTLQAIGTPITYQGTLDDGGVPANGSYDFQFQLKFGNGTNAGTAIVREDVNVVGGLFSALLDFGNAFPGTDRLLGISVRPGASSGAFTALTPDLAVNATPYALFSNDAAFADTAGLADDVIDFAIDDIDINTGAVTSEKIAADAVTASKLANNSVLTANIVDGSIAAADIASNAVTASEIAADAVAASELANNSVGVDNLIGGQNFGGVLGAVSLNGNSCATFDIAFGGGFEAGDLVLVNVAGTLPSHMMISALGVPSDDVVRLRICNNGTAAQSFPSLPLNVISIR